MLLILQILVASVLSGFLLTLWEAPVVRGSALASGAGEKLAVRISAPLIILAATALSGFFPETSISLSRSFAGSGHSFIQLGFATALAAIVAGSTGRFPAVPYAFLGAVFGMCHASGCPVGTGEVFSYIISWILAPILCGVIAAGVYKLLSSSENNTQEHLIAFESKLLKVSTVASLLLFAAFAWNTARIFSFIPAEGLGPGLNAAAMSAAALFVCQILTFRRARASEWTIADSDLDVNSRSTLSVVVAMAAVFIVFSIPGISRIGLAATPLSAGSLFVAALVGISLARGQALIEGEEILQSAFGTVLAPVLGALLSYCICLILSPNPINILILLGLTVFVALVWMYLKWRNNSRIRKQLLQAREQQVYSTQKSLSALEVKAEMTEKDLNNKLDRKRKELVDFAVGISDQKKFMETLYEDLKKMRAMPDGPEKDARTDQILYSLRERMYFSKEMNDFYARSEVLHKDFNLRLSEAYPNLTENEKRLANLLRQGFSSKHIASLMNIAPKSVEISRYRLRSKLGLQKGENLIQFIKNI